MSTPPSASSPPKTPLNEGKNPSSLSGNNDKVPRKKQAVKPPLAEVSIGRFLTYLVGGLVLLAAFYTWRFTVWAADVGGYWNLVTGHRNPPSTGPGEAALKAAGGAMSAHRSRHAHDTVTSASAVSSKPRTPAEKDADVQTQIVNLANALGVKPAELSNAIRPLIDPSVPNPAQAAQLEADILKAKLTGGGEAGEKKEPEGSLLGALGEAFLD